MSDFSRDKRKKSRKSQVLLKWLIHLLLTIFIVLKLRSNICSSRVQAVRKLEWKFFWGLPTLPDLDHLVSLLGPERLLLILPADLLNPHVQVGLVGEQLGQKGSTGCPVLTLLTFQPFVESSRNEFSEIRQNFKQFIL